MRSRILNMLVISAIMLSAHLAGGAGFALHGKVTASGKPVAGATVTINGVSIQAMTCKSSRPNCRNPPPSKPPIPAPIQVTTRSDGSFEISDLPRGEYSVTVVAVERRKRRINVRLDAEKTIAITVEPKR